MRTFHKLFLFCCFLTAAISAQATNIYPEWFLFPQKYKNIIVGYSYNGMPAVVDAESMFCAFKECIVLGTLEVYENSSVDDLLKNSNYFYYFSPDEVEKVHNCLFPVDRFDISVMTRDYIMAFSFDSTLNLQAPRYRIEDLKRPDWTEKNFADDGRYYYGVGMYTAIGNENDAWKTAEEQAIFTILTALAIQVHKVNFLARDSGQSEGEVAIEQISFVKVKYLLRNIEVVERYPDRENKLYYVQVRVPKGDVKSPLMR